MNMMSGLERVVTAKLRFIRRASHFRVNWRMHVNRLELSQRFLRKGLVCNLGCGVEKMNHVARTLVLSPARIIYSGNSPLCTASRAKGRQSSLVEKLHLASSQNIASSPSNATKSCA
jgi:hypothetical protein